MSYSFKDTNKTELAIKEIKGKLGFYHAMIDILQDMFDLEKEICYIIAFKDGKPVERFNIIKESTSTESQVELDLRKIRIALVKIRKEKLDWGLTHNHPMFVYNGGVAKSGISFPDIVSTQMIRRAALKIAPLSLYMGHYVTIKENQDPMHKVYYIEKNFKYSRSVLKEIEDGKIK